MLHSCWNQPALRTMIALVLVVAGSSGAATTASVPSSRVTLPAPQIERVSPESFERLRDDHRIVLIDVRPFAAYLHAHLPGAVWIPIDRLEAAMARLRAANATIVIYCGGEAGKESGRAAALLKQHGFDDVYCLEGGYERWIASGRVVLVQPEET